MRRVLAFVLPLFLIGCQGGDTPAPSDTVVKAATPEVKSPHEVPRDTPLAMYNGEQAVKLDSLPRTAFEVFPSKDSPVDKKLPPGFSDPYGASHWDDGRGHGFGVITFDGRVVAAMYQETQAAPTRFDDLVDLHQKHFDDLRPQSEYGPNVRYRFWQSGVVRLMICEYKGADGNTRVTVGLGVDNVMDALGASDENAKKSIAAVAATGHQGSPPTSFQSP